MKHTFLSSELEKKSCYKCINLSEVNNERICKNTSERCYWTSYCDEFILNDNL